MVDRHWGNRKVSPVASGINLENVYKIEKYLKQNETHQGTYRVHISCGVLCSDGLMQDCSNSIATHWSYRSLALSHRYVFTPLP